jgi:hypothetical protein
VVNSKLLSRKRKIKSSDSESLVKEEVSLKVEMEDSLTTLV